MSLLPASMSAQRVGQVGIIVEDLEASLRTYAQLLAVEEWTIYTYSPATVPVLGFRGGRGRFSMRIALGGREPQVELIQPLEGPSLYHEWLASHGPGVHHIGFFVEAIDAAIAAMADHGFLAIQHGAGYGRDGDGGFAYFETTPVLGFISEAIEVPKRRRRPEAVWRHGLGLQDAGE